MVWGLDTTQRKALCSELLSIGVTDRSAQDAVRRPRFGPADAIDASAETDEALQAGYADRIRSGRSLVARGLMRAVGIHLAVRLMPRVLLDDPEILAVGGGSGWVRLRHTGHVPDRRACLERQGALVALPVLFGLEPFVLEDVSCVARGDDACEYLLRSRRAPRWAVVVAAGCSALVVAAVVRPPARIDLLLGLVGAALVYAAERWRSDRAARANRLAAAHAFRRLVDRVSAVDPAPSDEVAATDAPSRPAGDPSPILEQEGDVWRITYAGVTIRVRHSRGLALLSHLLRRPGEELHVQTLDLLVPSAGAAGERLPVDPDALPQDGMSLGLGDAGPVIDDRARAEYRRRLADLRAELDDAERCNDPGRAAAARVEAEQLGEELRAAAGLHGRTRRMSSDVDRMRIAVTRRIRAAIEHLGKLHPALGDHLERSVRTGFACCYAPGAGPERALR